MNTKIKTEKTKNELTLSQLSKEIKKLRNDYRIMNESLETTYEDMEESLEIICMKIRRDVPVIFQNDKQDVLFKTFNLKRIPKVGEVINLIPTLGSCCLNENLMNEYDLSENEMIKHIENKTPFSFIAGETMTNLTVLDSHPEDEWEDLNGINFSDDNNNMTYVVTLYPNNKCKKEVLIEKMR